MITLWRRTIDDIVQQLAYVYNIMSVACGGLKLRPLPMDGIKMILGLAVDVNHFIM